MDRGYERLAERLCDRRNVIRVNVRTAKTNKLRASNTKRFFKMGRKLVHPFPDLGGLLHEGAQHTGNEGGVELNQFRRGHYESQVAIDIVPQRRQALVQFLDLLDAESHRFRRQCHGETMSSQEFQCKSFPDFLPVDTPQIEN